MVEITPTHDHVTVINVFRVKPGAQADALERLLAVNARIAQETGWISASVHRSFDGLRVANYAQWQTREAIMAALRHPGVAPLLARLAEVSEADWHLYEVVSAEAAT